MLFADLIGVAHEAASAPKRSDQVDLIARLISDSNGDVAAAVAWLTGERRREFGAAITEIPQDSAVSPTLTVADVDAALTAIADGPSEDGAGASTWRTLHERLTEREQGFVRDVLGGESPAPASESVVISAIAKSVRVRVGDLKRASAILGSVASAAEIAVDSGADGLAAVDVVVGRPVPPMRPMRVIDIADGVSGMERVAMEWKLTGERVQAHRGGSRVVLFDTAGTDITAEHGDVKGLVGGLPGGDLVLDGVIGGSAVWFFDILFDGSPMIDEPLRRRREHLERIIPDAHLAPVVEVASGGDVDALFDVAVAGAPAGIVVKDVSSTYEPGHRGRAWRRVGRAHQFVVVVIGAESGSGGRQGSLSTLHLGARRADGEYEMIGKTSRGLTDELIDWQTERLRQLVIDPLPDQPRGVVRVRPEQVVEISAGGVQASDRDGGSVALDAIRIKRYREDVSADGATTLEQIADMIGKPPSTDGPTLERHDGAPVCDGIQDASTEPAPLRPTLPAPVRRPEPPPESPGAASRSGDPLMATPLFGTAHPRNAALNIDFDFPSYEPPVLDRSSVPLRAVLAARVVAVLWVLAMAIAAVAARWSADGGQVDGSTVTFLGRFVVAVAAALMLTGWWWSDQRTRNLQRLDGRRPGRLRSVTAWVAPVIGVSFLVFAIVPLEPSELLDLRPIAITLVFPVALWRPYALVRRIFATLIRLRFDALIVVAFLFDVVSFGLVWWWLTVWPSSDESALAGEIDVMVGIGLAVSLTTAISGLVWFLLLRAGVAAEGHREASQRTRYEHRMLRLRGADPTEPAVWWALVQRRAEEQRELAESTDVDDTATTLATVGATTVEALLENVRQRNGHALRRLGADDSTELMGRLRAQFVSVIGEPRAARKATSEAATEAPPRADERRVDATPAAGVPSTREWSVASSPAGDAAAALATPPAVPVKTERFSRIRQSLGVDPELAARVEASPIEHLLDYAGAVQVEAAVAERNRRLAERAPDERMLPPTLYRLEAVRFLLLVALAGATVAALWLMNRTLGAGSATVASASEKAADIDEARRVLIIALSVALVLVPLWHWVASIYAQRCGATEQRHGVGLPLFLVAAAASVTAGVLDGTDRGSISFVLLAVIVVCASASGLSLVQARAWFGLRSVSVVAWSAVLPVTLAILLFGGLDGPTNEVDSLQAMTLAAVLAALGCGLAVVLVALSTEDFEDEVKLSPELSVPASSRRRRRRRRW